jgi:hypothetical protein
MVTMAAHRPTRRRLQRWIRIGWGGQQLDELGVQVAALGPQHPAQL